MIFILKETEVLEELGIKNYKIIQSQTVFKFGTDSVLLSNFVKVKKGEKVADLGTGTGIIPILLIAKNENCEIYGIELNPISFDMAYRTIKLNNLQEKIKIINADLRKLDGILSKNEFDIVVCNPPYKQENTGLINKNENIKSARHEATCTLEDVIICAKSLLKFGGRFYLIHKPERLSDIICLMRKHKIEAKKLCFVHSDIKKEPSLILIEGKSGGKSGIRIQAPITINN